MGALAAILTIVGALALCGIVAWVIIGRTKKQAYQGMVVDKKESVYTDSEGANYSRYVLTVKLDEGGEKQVTVGRKVYDQFAVNDRIAKTAGALNPVKG